MGWSMNLRQIHEAAPDVVYLLVQNACSSTISLGHAAFFNYNVTDGAAAYTANTSLYVTLNATTAANQLHAGLFAGPVAKTDIAPKSWGYVQLHGPHPGVYVTGFGAAAGAPFAGYTAFFGVTNLNTGSLATVVLKPVNCFGNTTGAVTNAGYFGPVGFGTTLSATGGDAMKYWPGGYLVPLDNVNGAVSISTNSSGSVKAFCRCM